MLNRFFFFSPAQNFEDAIEYYTKAIDLNPNVAAYFGNRSFAYLKTECFGSALEDASQALKLDRSYMKVFGFSSLLPTRVLIGDLARMGESLQGCM